MNTSSRNIPAIAKIVAGLLVIAGLVLAIYPELISNKPIPDSTFEAVERRIHWGYLIGIGVLFLIHFQLKPWQLTVAAAGTAITLGLFVARFIGIALDGSVIEQWYWVGVESVIFAIFSIWFVKQKGFFGYSRNCSLKHVRRASYVACEHRR